LAEGLRRRFGYSARRRALHCRSAGKLRDWLPVPQLKDLRMRSFVHLILLIFAPLVLFAACDRDGPAERAGRTSTGALTG